MQTEIGQYDAMAELTESLPSDFCSWSHFGQGEYLEAKYFLPGYLLSSQGDRMAMAHSVEGRYPFLDYRVVEFGAKLPARLKMRVLNEKCLLKQACDGLVPESIIRRPKQSYRAPEGRCFFDENAPDYVEELLSPTAVERAGVFDERAVSILKSKFTGGKEGSFKDNMGVVAVLSTQLLATQFIHQTTGVN
jgi:asparagine synthase (glutamine-hydrolysing)